MVIVLGIETAVCDVYLCWYPIPRWNERVLKACGSGRVALKTSRPFIVRLLVRAHSRVGEGETIGEET